MSAATFILIVVSLAGWGQPAGSGHSAAPGPQEHQQARLLREADGGDPLRPTQPPAAEAADLSSAALGMAPNPTGRGWAARRSWPGGEAGPLPDCLLCVEGADPFEPRLVNVNLQLRI